MGLNQGAVGNTLGEHIGNVGNIEGTKKKMIKTLLPPALTQNLKEKKSRHLLPLHWLHEISLSKTVSHHFSPGLMSGSVI
jgi:hypothetical protein